MKEYARFIEISETCVKIKFLSTDADSLTATLECDGKVVGSAVAMQMGDGVCMCDFGAQTARSMDFSRAYTLHIAKRGSEKKFNVLIPSEFDTELFMKRFEGADSQSAELGAIYTPECTTFRLWAPLALSVKLKLYANGTDGGAIKIIPMQKYAPHGKFGGVWFAEQEGDLDGVYYNFAINNFSRETETVDPYARACGANGVRGMVVDLKRTDPDGWQNDVRLYRNAPAAADTPIVWEVSVSDFSASADSGMKYRGKFLAFTERDTTVPGTDIKTGVAHLKDLGVSYVHLNPVYDFATLDESDLTLADKSSFNWGYDPQNYNVPEGSFSTDAADGAVRINEFKRMVAALHSAGIGVVMDVVYNHTFAIGGQSFHDSVPFYYHRTDEAGGFTNDSGCGNGTASERAMVRKYIIESVVYWAEEYHIDGFRFDLMGIHDAITMNAVRKALDGLDGGRGKKILMYGEPWSADGGYTPFSYLTRCRATAGKNCFGKYSDNTGNNLIKFMFESGLNGDETAFDMLSERIAVFNGSGRDGLRGACIDRAPRHGWVNGNTPAVYAVKRMIEGGVGGYAHGLLVGKGSRNVAYAAAHDNYTLWDQVRGAKHGDESALFYDPPIDCDIRRIKLVAAAYMINPGISFLLAGEEMGRTKYGNENAYNSPTKLNMIVWSRLIEFAELNDFFKRIIAMKKSCPALFSYTKSQEKEYSLGRFIECDAHSGRIEFEREAGGHRLHVELCPQTLSGKITLDGSELII